jgi:hypothetical protein
MAVSIAKRNFVSQNGGQITMTTCSLDDIDEEAPICVQRYVLSSEPQACCCAENLAGD